MRGLRGRVSALEVSRVGGELSLTVRAWLGHSLSPAETLQAAVEAHQVPLELDWSKLSKEMCEWLEG